jgi:hypothetical protein
MGGGFTTLFISGSHNATASKRPLADSAQHCQDMLFFHHISTPFLAVFKVEPSLHIASSQSKWNALNGINMMYIMYCI